MPTEVPVTWTQLIITVIFLLVVTLSPQFYQIYNRRLEAQEKKRVEDAAQKEKERNAQDTAEETTWKRVVSEYERALDSVHNKEEELKQLRPLALQNAVLEQRMAQCKEDKEDWKAHALRLETQLQEQNIIPLPFRRNPREDTGEQLKTVSQKMRTIKDNHTGNATVDSPTLIFPPAPVKEEGKL
jgi:predicted transcriptional regulator